MIRRILSCLLINCACAVASLILYLSFAPRPRMDHVALFLAWAMAYSNTIGLIAAFLLPWLGPKFYRYSVFPRWMMIIGTLLLIGVTGSVLASAVLYSVGVIKPNEVGRDFINATKMSVVLTLAFGIGSFVFHEFQGRLERATLTLRTRELEKERALKLASEAQLQSLESRIHPHFLFNALNSVSSLIREDPSHAEEQVERISRFLRFSLDRGSMRVVSLAEEMRIVADYLEIERTRFGDRLRYSIDVNPTAESAAVPPMSVQTLVENSVKYAVAPRRGGGEIRVTARTDGDRLLVGVWDDGPGFSPEMRSAGHGLDLLEGRLKAQFGDAALLSFRNGHGMTVGLEIPCERS